MAWMLTALKSVNVLYLLKEAAKIMTEARKLYEASKKNEKQEAELIKDMAIQLEALTNGIGVLRRTLMTSLVLGVGATVLAIISLIAAF